MALQPTQPTERKLVHIEQCPSEDFVPTDRIPERPTQVTTADTNLVLERSVFSSQMLRKLELPHT
jgi:hypothetical protein